MKEKILQLENLLTEISELVEQHITIEKIDLKDYDTFHTIEGMDIEEWQKHHAQFRKTIISYKNDKEFYEIDIPKIEKLLSTALTQLQEFRNISSGKFGKNFDNRANGDIIELLKQKILTTHSLISGEMKGLVFSGYLTEDGYLELSINGVKIKFGSLRKAAIRAWGTDVPSQWKFWNVINEEGEKISLDFYRNKLVK